MSLTSELTILPNAAPIMMPTAMSTTLPLTANSRNSFAMLMAVSPCFSGQSVDAVVGSDAIRLRHRRVVERRAREITDVVDVLAGHHGLADVHDLGSAVAEAVHAEHR